MKKVKWILMVYSLFVLTGCVKFNTDMEINLNKSMDYSITIAVDKTMIKDEKALTDEQLKLMENKGFVISDYSIENMDGYILSKKIENIDNVSTDKDNVYDLSGMISSRSDNNYLFKVEKGFLKNTYKAVIKFNPEDSGLSTDDNENETYNLPTDLKFHLSLPFGAISSNAIIKENGNKNLTWILSANEPMEIKFDFYMYNLEVVLIGIGLLLIIIAFIIFIISKRNGKKEEVEINETNINISNDDNNDFEEPVLKKKVTVMEESKS